MAASMGGFNRTIWTFLTLALIACSPSPKLETNTRSSHPIETAQNSTDDEQRDETENENENASEDAAEEATAPAFESGDLNVQWIHGAENCNNDQNPPLQVHQYNSSYYILRQNKCLNFEAPFMYLILGQNKALLFDTGATGNANTFPLRTMVEEILTSHLAQIGVERSAYDLVVAHSHAHGDHRAADNQFNNQENTVVVAPSVNDMTAFFGFNNWPNDSASYDLGNRMIDIIGIPGHETNSIAIYDRKTATLLTGDTIYPGRLYIAEWNTYRQSIQRLAQFVSGKALSFVLGAHIEMSDQPGVDFPMGSTFQPNEHILQLEGNQIQELNTALEGAGDNPQRIVRNKFIIFPTSL
ncbi:MAG: MBL fold metallo-hydrolase [Oligoflexus sp.]